MKLFEDWLSAKRRTGNHNGAFGKSRFEQRFDVSEEGLEHLARLSEMSRTQDVYLVCQCKTGERCHRELVLMLAKKLYKANAEKPRNDYPIYAQRLKSVRPKRRKKPKTP